MSDNERKAKEMWEKGESPSPEWLYDSKSAAEETKKRINEGKGVFESDISSKDAKKINDIYMQQESTWSREARDAEEGKWDAMRQEIRENDLYFREVGKKREAFREAILSGREQIAEEKIAEMTKLIHERWRKCRNEYGYSEIKEWEEMNYRVEIFCTSLSNLKARFDTTGSILGLMEYFGECIRKEIYFLSKYKKELRIAKAITSEIDTKFLSQKRNQLIGEYLREHWETFVSPYNFDEKFEDISDWKFGYQLTEKKVRKVLESYITPLRKEGYGLKQTLKEFIVEGICIQEFLKEGKRLSSFDSQAIGWGFGLDGNGMVRHNYFVKEINDETIFILVYCLCCYQYAEFLLDKNVGKVEEIIARESYSLQELKETLRGEPGRAGIFCKEKNVAYALVKPRYSVELFDIVSKGERGAKEYVKNKEVNAEVKQATAGCLGLLFLLASIVGWGMLIFAPKAMENDTTVHVAFGLAIGGFIALFICARKINV